MRRLSFWFLLLLAIFCLYVVTELFRSYRAVETGLEERVRVGVKTLEDHMERTFGEIESTMLSLDDLCQSGSVMPATNELEVHRRLKAVVGRLPQINSAVLVDLYGTVAAEATIYPSSRRNVGDRPYFTAPLQGSADGLFIETPIISRLTGLPIFTASIALRDVQNQVCAVLSVAVNPTYFEHFYALFLGQDRGVISLHLADGRFLVRFPTDARMADNLTPAEDHKGRHGVLAGRAEFDGIKRITAYRKSDRYPLMIRYGIDQHTVWVRWRSEVGGFLLLAGAFLLLFGFAWFSTAMRHRQLANEKRRLDLIIRSANLGTWDWDVRVPYLTINRLWADMLGLDPAHHQHTLSSWEERIHPDDRDRVQAAVHAHLAAETEQYACEYRMRHADGRWIWILGAGQVVERDGQGQAIRALGIHLDISQRKAMELELERSNAELKQFAYAASHDLRQPLRMVNSYVQMLERRLQDKLDDDTRKMMHYARDGALRMDQMLVSLLEYSRVGRVGQPQALIDSRARLDEALHFLAPAVKAAQATISITGDWPQIWASPDEMTRLFQNLVDNALKYHAADTAPEVRISVEPDRSGWRFIVSDNGIGIDPAQAGRLFTMFQRLQTREKFDGTGVGLAICRKIVERHGGQIWVESAGEGLGSRFCFTLPQPPEAMPS